MSTRAGSSPSLAPNSLKPLTPRITLRQEACQVAPSSAPSSPTCRTHRIRAAYGYPSQPQSARVDKTFFGNATVTDSMRDHDDGDPHDLSFPTKHFPRASMVDNLVLSLDQFTPSHDTTRGHAPQPVTNKNRGHAKSSSLTVASDENNNTIGETPTIDVHPAQEDIPLQQPEQIPNIFGEEEETQRDKAYNAQRAMQSTKPAPAPARSTTRTKSRSNSNSSSIDLGHLAAYATRLGPAGNRRSQSFDFGSVRPKPAIDSVETTGPAVTSQTTESTTAVANNLPGQTVGRRNSGRSIKGHHSRKERSGTVSAANFRAKMESPQPQMAHKSQMSDGSDAKNKLTIQPEHNSPAPRAGFFRRVFGSSNKSSMGPSSYPSPSRQSHDRSISTLDVRRPSTPPMKTQKQPPADPSQNKENQPTITKKPSSFFRRRKKSVSGGVPPPLPLTLNNNVEPGKPEGGASSPVSSLRALMDPYLGENAPKHVRGSSLQSVQNADDIISTHRLSQSKDHQRKQTAPPVPKDKTIANGHVKDNLSAAASALASAVAAKPDTEVSKTPSPVKAYGDKVQKSSSRTVAPEPIEQTVSKSSAVQVDEKNESLKITQSPPLQPPPLESRSSAKMIKIVPRSSGSDISEYKSAPSTPLVADLPDRKTGKSPIVHVSHPSISEIPVSKEAEQARRIYENIDDDVTSANATAWLGEATAERENVRSAYMSLFDWTSMTIVAALRNLCSKLVLKGETQQVDRILDAFARRWCECNPNHGFKSADIVHTICYSVLLLNTDLHLADIGRKMTRAEFVRNALDTIKENMPSQAGQSTDTPNHLTVRTNSNLAAGGTLRSSTDRSASSLSTRPTENLSREESYDESNPNMSGPLVEDPFHGSQAAWEMKIELVLKEVYASISREPLPLFGSTVAPKFTPQPSTSNLSALSTLRRTPSTISKATSENRGRYAGESRSLGARWASKTRSRPRIGTAGVFGSSRTSIDDQSSAWSPSMSSTWSKVSLNKTLTSMSVESFGTDHLGGGYQSSIGFANALSQAIIRDEQMDGHVDDGIKAVPLLEDESLELYGAPWAKEGILKHKCHLEGVDKRSKDRNWNDCFAVIEKGWMRLFSFSMTAKSLRNKARNHKAGAVVGGGNWQDNAEEVWKFMLRHTIASALPPPGYSKQRPYVWALSLPNGAVHLFSVGTPDIVKEFVTTANFWSARLSKEPMTGGVSSMEYGWSDSVVNRALVSSDSHPSFKSSSPRPSTQLSMRSSMDHGNIRPRLPGDKVHISEWVPPQQSLTASQLLEIDQLKALQAYVKNIEEDLQKHNELRGPMLLAFSARHPNSQKAMSNWEKKSSYLLREIVKFRTYIDALQSAQGTKEKVDKLRKEQELSQRAELDSTEV